MVHVTVQQGAAQPGHQQHADPPVRRGRGHPHHPLLGGVLTPHLCIYELDSFEERTMCLRVAPTRLNISVRRIRLFMGLLDPDQLVRYSQILKQKL